MYCFNIRPNRRSIPLTMRCHRGRIPKRALLSDDVLHIRRQDAHAKPAQSKLLSLEKPGVLPTQALPIFFSQGYP